MIQNIFLKRNRAHFIKEHFRCFIQIDMVQEVLPSILANIH